MATTYVQKRDGVYRVANSRVSLDSIAYAFLNGETAENIAQSFPTLRLEQVYGAIAYYLAHRQAIDEYLEQGEQDFQALRLKAREADPAFYRKLADARRVRAAGR